MAEMAIPAALSVGSKLIGGAAGGGGGGAPAAAGPSPLTAGLLSPPTPERNPLLHDTPDSDVNGSRLIRDTPLPKIQGLLEDYKDPNSIPVRRDSSSEFRNAPWTTETQYSQDGLLPSAPDRNPYRQMSQPVAEATPDSAPAPSPAPRIDLAGEKNTQGQHFDTSAPSKPGEGASQQLSGLFGDPASWLTKLPANAQAYFKGVPTNPMAQVGLGLLASGYDGSNPFTNMQGGLNSTAALGLKINADAREKAEAEQKLAAYMQQLMLAQEIAKSSGVNGTASASGSDRAPRASVIR